MGTIGAWRDFYMMGGGATAAMTGLLFVAMSIHLEEILAVRPLTRNIAVALYGLLYQLAFCGFMLVPGVTLVQAGVVVMVAGTLFALASVRVGSQRSRLDTALNAAVGIFSCVIGILMILGWAPALYLCAGVFGLSVTAIVRLCWRLLTMAVTGLPERHMAALSAGEALHRAASR